MGGWEFANKVWDGIAPYLGYFVALGLLWGLNKVAGETFPAMLAGGWEELKNVLQGKTNLKSLNAVGVVILALLVLVLFGASPLHDLFLPNQPGGDQADHIEEGIFAFLIFFFGATLIGSLWISRLEP